VTEIITYFFRGLCLDVSIGLNDSERAAPQRILIDLDYDAGNSAGGADQVAGFLNYDTVRRDIEAVAARGHFNLQETLCRAILETVMGYEPVVRARVSTRKPDVYADCEAVGVSMETRRRAVRD
jgi:dihydroneopterin aldolase